MTWVTEAEELHIRRCYDDKSMLNDEIASDLDMSVEEFREACISIGLPHRSDPDIYVPTPQQILAAAAQIRSTWTNADREERLRSAWPEA